MLSKGGDDYEKNYISNFNFNLTCPNCHGSFKVSSSQVGSTINCQFCHKTINLQDNGFSSGINQVNKSIDDFTKDLKNMFK